MLTSILLGEFSTSQMKNVIQVSGKLQSTVKNYEALNPIKIVHYSFKDFCFENIWTQSVSGALPQIFPSYVFIDKDRVIVGHYLDIWWPLCPRKKGLVSSQISYDIVKIGNKTSGTVSHKKMCVKGDLGSSVMWL